MIKKPEDFELGEKKIRMLLAGPPGIGKSTLAMSAPAPLLIDTDGGFDRVEFMYRKDRLVANSYQNPQRIYVLFLSDSGKNLRHQAESAL